MAREIDLIMNQKSAPAELTAAVQAHQKNYTKLVKAEADLDAAKTAKKAAQTEYDKTGEAYEKLLAAWQVKV